MTLSPRHAVTTLVLAAISATLWFMRQTRVTGACNTLDEAVPPLAAE